jgi:D-threo-aldose 1-dehydrogenase
VSDVPGTAIDPFETVSVGSTGVTVTRVGFGTAPLGGLYQAVGDEQAAGALARGLEAGFGYFDSAPHYGWGLAEQRLGAALAATERTPSVGTKVGYGLRPAAGEEHVFIGAPPLEPYVDWTEAGVRRSFESSLERLGVDRVDILYLHDPASGDFDELVRVGAAAARRWQDEGMVGAVGAGMNTAADALALLELVDLDVMLIAGRVSLLDQTAVTELLPRCEQRGVSIIVGGVFNSGILARADASARFDYEPATAAVTERARAIATTCERYEVPLAAAALQFPFRYPAVTSVIPGMRSAEEVDENLELLAHEIPDELWSGLNERGLVPLQ